MATAEIIARLGLNTSDFEGGLKKGKKELNSFESGVKELKSTLAGAFAIGAISDLVSETVEFGSKIADTSTKLGVSAEALQKLNFAAKQSGTDLGAVSTGLEKLSVSMKKALGGSQESIDSFQALGVSVSDLSSLSVDEIFLKISDAVESSSDPTKTLADVIGVMGKSSGDLIPLLAEGSEGITKMGDDAQRLGIILNDDAINRLDALGDRMEVLKQQSISAGSAIVEFGFNIFHAIEAAGAIVEKTIAGLLGDVRGVEIANEKLAKIGSENLQINDAAPKAKAGGKGARFNRDVETSSAEQSKADKIAGLQAAIAKEAEDQARSLLSIEEQITALKYRQVGLEDDAATARSRNDEEGALKSEKERLDINKQISALNKQDQDDRNHDVAEFGKTVKANLEDQAKIDQIKSGKGISVSAPITDSLARIGGFVGHTGDRTAGIAEKQLTVNEKMLEELKTIATRRYINGEDDFTAN